MMKSLRTTLVISIVILAASFLNTVAANACENPAISRVQELGFMQGISATEFAPEMELTRAQVITILHRMDGCPDDGRGSLEAAGYRDVNHDAWYYGAMSWVYSHGISVGSEWLMCPDDPMTREELAAILYRHAEEEYRETEAVSIPEETSGWVRVPMKWAVATDLLTAENPQGFVTRAEMAEIAVKYWDFLNYRADILDGWA